MQYSATCFNQRESSSVVVVRYGSLSILSSSFSRAAHYVHFNSSSRLVLHSQNYLLLSFVLLLIPSLFFALSLSYTSSRNAFPDGESRPLLRCTERKRKGIGLSTFPPECGENNEGHSSPSTSSSLSRFLWRAYIYIYIYAI